MAEYILEIKNLKKYYGKSRGIENVTIKLEKGDIYGFIGPNGAGKSTTIRTLIGLINKTDGEILLKGEKINTNDPKTKEIIGYLPSEINLYGDMTLKELFNYHESFYKKDLSKRRKELVKALKIDENKKVEDLSLGNLKKAGIVLALMHEPEILILDEPTSGLDPVSREEVLDIFREIVKSGDRAILFSTHITSDLDKCASNITYIHNGQIVFTGKKKDFVNSYLFVKDKTMNKDLEKEYIAYKELDDRIEGLINVNNKEVFIQNNIKPREPDLEEIMIYLERSHNNESFTL